MKISFISDLHLEFRPRVYLSSDDTSALGTIGFDLDAKPDLVVIAGDVHPRPDVCELVKSMAEEHYGCPVMMIEGNHEYYHREFPMTSNQQTMEVCGKKIVGATLWTWATPIDEIYKNMMSDFRVIRGMSVDAMNNRHLDELDFLRRSDADVIVTHHAPFSGSTHPKYAGNALNPYFVNTRIDPADFPNCKLWIHGHVHDAFDYTVNGIRVVCAPLAYPNENTGSVMRSIEI